MMQQNIPSIIMNIQIGVVSEMIRNRNSEALLPTAKWVELHNYSAKQKSCCIYNKGYTQIQPEGLLAKNYVQ